MLPYRQGRNGRHRIADDLRCSPIPWYPEVLAGAFFVSSGMQFYLYLAKIRSR